MSGLLDRRALKRFLQVAFERDAPFITDSDSTFAAASDQLEEILIDGSFAHMPCRHVGLRYAFTVVE